jgi:predicted HTH domain antitoxin
MKNMLVRCDIEIPEKVIKILGLRESEVGEMFKRELSAYFFERNLLSFGQARQFAGLSVWDFLGFLRERKIPLHYDLTEYDEDLKTIRELS